MKTLLKLASSTLALTVVSTLPAFAEPKVITSIKPIHSLVSGVMKGVGTPALLVDGSASPHDYALKPSNAQALQDADIVFWIGKDLETFLESPLKNIAGKAKSVELMELSGLEVHEFRDDDDFKSSHDEHGHDSHDHDDHSKEAKADDHDHDHEEHSKADKHEHGHEEHAKHDDHDHDDHAKEAKADDHEDHGHDHAGHDHGGKDGHLWLDTHNAEKIVTAIAAELSKLDPGNKAKYQANAQAMHEKLEALEEQLKVRMEPLEDASYIVFHDAYQYFERQFGLSPSGTITVSPEIVPGAERISQLQETIRDTNASCVFSEPQFSPRIVSTIIDGTAARTAVVDPLGSQLENGPELYFDLINGMADSFSSCLSNTN